MTPKQKKQRLDSLDMIKFLGIKGYFTKMSYTHMRRIIEDKKIEILNALGIDATNGFEQVTRL